MREPEVTRVRVKGTKVTLSRTPAEKLAALRDIVAEGQYAKIDGSTVDLFSASVMTRVYDALNEVNRAKFLALPISKMAKLAFQLLK